MSAYRIAQEALTNVTRHARSARAFLEVKRQADEMTITVTDDGGAGPGDGGRGSNADAVVTEPGLGIAGMRERALLHGGAFRAGPRPGGGFEVVAVLPSERSRTVANKVVAAAGADRPASEDSAA
jgi:signal transduction histidine kinase